MGLPRLYSESFTMNGTDFSVQVEWPIAYQPRLYLDGVQQTIYETGVDASGEAAWYWDSGSAVMTHGTSTPPANGVVVRVDYQTLVSNAIKGSSPAEITTRSAQGGSGIWETVVDIRGVDDEDTLIERNTAILRNNSVIAETFEFETDYPGWRPNQTLPMPFAELDLSGTWSVDSISAKGERTTGDLGHGSAFRYTVRCYKVQTAPVLDPPDPDTSIPAFPSKILYPEDTWTDTRLAQRTEPGNPRLQVIPFVFGVGSDIAAGQQSENAWPVRDVGYLYDSCGYATTPPTGQAAVIDITCNGVSIFRGATKINIPAGASVVVEGGSFVGDEETSYRPYPIFPGDILRAQVTYLEASDTTTAARGVTALLRYSINHL
jgi:hypothetical protein